MTEEPANWQQWMTSGFAVVVALCLVIIIWLVANLLRVRREREEIEGEEYRMFDFLHGLGEKMLAAGSARAMHRAVVSGVVKVVGARGGILYLHDASRNLLIPSYVSVRCPALMPVQPEILAALKVNTRALRGHQQLQVLPMDHGPAADCFRAAKAQVIVDFPGLLPATDGMDAPDAGPVMLAPMYRGEEPLGLLVVARKADAEGFSANDFSVFQSAAEQSGFALLNAMTHKEASEKRRLESELKTASEIQRILLPDDDPVVPGYRIRGMNKPARYVSGDYFDYLPVDDTRTGVVIADVSGKGVAASLITAMCRSVLRTAAPANLSPSDALARLNRMLYPDMREDMFISLAYLLVNALDGQIILGRAGHDAPLLYRAATATVERVICPGLALGIDEGPVFERVTRDYIFTMHAGDLLLLYTDGANEALDIHGDEFGLDRVIEILRTRAPEGAAAVIEAISSAVTSFVGEHPQSDDITLIAIEKCG